MVYTQQHCNELLCKNIINIRLLSYNVSFKFSGFEEIPEPSQSFESQKFIKTTNSKIKDMFRDFTKKTEGLQEAFIQCALLARHLKDCENSRNLVLEECQTFDIEYKDLVVPSADNWTTDIYCVKSVLDLKVAIFFAGERDKKFEEKYPSVESIQLLENVAPIFEKILELWGTKLSTDMLAFQEVIPGLCTLSEDLKTMSEIKDATQQHAKALFQELKFKFPSF